MRQTELHLSPDDRVTVEAIRAKGTHSAREVNRAHILLALHRRIPEAQVMAVLGVGRMMIWRTRAAYLDGGLDLALRDVQRSGRPRQYATEAEARVAALACSQAPQGSARWTVRLLHEVVQAETGLHPISRETVRRLLKKTASSRGEN